MAGELDLVLDLFKDNRELSTTDIIQQIYYEEWKDSENKKGTERKNAKARLHRKGIYHLNKLVEDGILTVTKYAEKGEKVFELKHTGNVIVNLPRKRIELTKNPFELKNLDYELDAGIIKVFSPFGVMINSAVINSSHIENLAQLNSITKELFKEVNDVIAVTNAEKLLSRAGMTEMHNFLSGITATLSGERKLTFIIDLINPHSNDIIKTLHLLAGENHDNTELVFLLDENDLISRTKLISQIIDIAQESNLKLNFCKRGNKFGYSGKAGSYQTRNTNRAVKAVTSNAIALDFHKVKEKRLTAAQIEQLFHKVMKALHDLNVKQKMHLEQYYPALTSLDSDLESTNNVIRIWNYDWKNDEYFFELLEDIKVYINEFTNTQENIYRSCGFPIDFKIRLGSAFNTFHKDLTTRHYEKKVVHNLEELKQMANSYLKLRIKYDGLFDQGDRVRVFRAKGNTREMLRELQFLLAKEIKFFTYDFRKLGMTINLRDFM